MGYFECFAILFIVMVVLLYLFSGVINKDNEEDSWIEKVGESEENRE